MSLDRDNYQSIKDLLAKDYNDVAYAMYLGISMGIALEYLLVYSAIKIFIINPYIHLAISICFFFLGAIGLFVSAVRMRRIAD